MDPPHVVIVGGGFGGLNAAKALAGAPVRVTLVDRRNYHLFQPLLYQVAIGGLHPADIAYPIRAIAELARRTLRRDFRRIDPAAARIVLIEGGPRILPTFSEPLARAAMRDLARLQVEVRTGVRVTAVEPDRVRMGDDSLDACTILWAAGIRACPLGRTLGLETDRSGRLAVGPDLALPGHPDVFVIGDLALFTHQGAAPLPGVAPVAIQQGRHAAANVLAAVRGHARRPFRYVDKGSMATVGRAAAIAEFPWGGRLHGFAAWVAWLGVHILYLIGFRSRLFVIMQWAWAYLMFDLAARLITERRWPVSEPER